VTDDITTGGDFPSGAATPDPLVTIAGQPFRARALVYTDAVMRDMYMGLLKRAPYLALYEDLLKVGDWAGDPRRWNLNVAELDDKERRIIWRFRDAAIKLWIDWDFDVDPQLARGLAEIREMKLPWDRLTRIANVRNCALSLADRHKPSEPRWRRLAADLNEVLEDGFFQLIASARRLAIQQLINGDWTATEGRQFLELIDLSFREGRTTLWEFGEYIHALDEADARVAS
jgi:hypothetical protein